MIFELSSQIVANGNKELIDKLTELAPLIIIGLLWLFGAIAKAVAGGKKEEQPQPQPPQAKPKQPDLGEFIRTIKQQYTEAREQVIKESQETAPKPQPPFQTPHPRPVSAQTPSPGPQYRPSVASAPARPAPKPYTSPPAHLHIQPDYAAASKDTMAAVKREFENSLAEQQLLDFTHGKIIDAAYAEEHHPYLAELTEQFANPDGLRKAFITYEILGKPIALRD